MDKKCCASHFGGTGVGIRETGLKNNNGTSDVLIKTNLNFFKRFFYIKCHVCYKREKERF